MSRVMQIDPVIEIAEELHRAETMVMDRRVRQDDELCRRLLSEISALNDRLFRTTATSALGAAEMLHRAALLLTDGFPRIAARMLRAGDRLETGRRRLEDLVWLRHIANDMADGLYGEEGIAAATLARSALRGASRPVLVFRAVTPRQDFRRKRTG